MSRTITSIESLCLINGSRDDVFYTHKKDKDITAIAYYYDKKVATERLILVGGAKDNPIAETITKVTIL
jgi:hypothetical protein